ncbi:DnaB-like helicase C-terminal domain-containing protein [Streptomyces sp. NPDC060065]|uniref:DnaB-like helicase C-terminal domain-containing protein n=1 Tax=Streptomyces sp. NPDC060065 TaxID=3347050 RepID=UPI0036A96E83
MNNIPGVLFTLESGRNEVAMRIVAAEARVPLHHIRSGQLQEDDWTRMARRMPEISAAPLYIQDADYGTLVDLRAQCRRLRSGISRLVPDGSRIRRGAETRRSRLHLVRVQTPTPGRPSGRTGNSRSGRHGCMDKATGAAPTGEDEDHKVVRPTRIRPPGSRHARRAPGPLRTSTGGLLHDLPALDAHGSTRPPRRRGHRNRRGPRAVLGGRHPHRSRDVYRRRLR